MCGGVPAGYSLNALVDFPADDPIEVIKHLIIGSEGTLGFVSQATYNTVPGKAQSTPGGGGGICLVCESGQGLLSSVAVLGARQLPAVLLALLSAFPSALWLLLLPMLLWLDLDKPIHALVYC
jgi:hypothetical protein